MEEKKSKMNTWKTLLSQSVTTFDDLKKHLNLVDDELKDVIANFPIRINPYFLDLAKKSGQPLLLQAIPDPAEIKDTTCIADPLGEEELSPVPNLVHKYPDRALFLVSNRCAMYCRFCTRKRKVGRKSMVINDTTLQQGYNYLEKTPAIREVLLSGGDPLLLEDEKIDEILCNLKRIKSIEVIRIGTRIPSVLPMRITPQLVSILKKYHPLFINTHFNHPDEITNEATLACEMLADAGIPLGNHTVLLKHINNDVETLRTLFCKLLSIRVKPYYLFQADLTKGTNHFRTHTSEGIEIMRQLIGHISGMAIPTFALDAPGGKGKIPLIPDYIIKTGSSLVFKNYTDEICSYPEVLL